MLTLVDEPNLIDGRRDERVRRCSEVLGRLKIRPNSE
jgi:hypothetical protein